MSANAISVEHLSKRYIIGHQRDPRDGLRHALEEAFRNPFRWLGDQKRRLQATREEFWALRDVSFEVKQGDVLGIIGRNGAGKSTLLKILSRITEPTEGRVRIKGRVASLLEVGTGFHQELTGRENIYLNGAILGMSKAEIKRKFDEIIAFSEVERFLDTPVKRYSSGMYVRLAFAVAAHLEPEILIVDEVLAVGDAQFQKKCIGRMGEVSRTGRTVLFVSHNMAAVRTLCNRAVLLQTGRQVLNAATSNVVNAYLDAGKDSGSEREWKNPDEAPGNEYVRLQYVRVRPPDREPVITYDTGAIVEIGFFNACPGINLDVTIYLTNSDGVLVLQGGQIVSSNGDSRVGSYGVMGEFPRHLLNTGRYFIAVVFGRNQNAVLYRIDDAVAFTIEHTTTGMGANLGQPLGVIRPLLRWTHQFIPACANQRSQEPVSIHA